MGIPTSGLINLSDFYGASAAVDQWVRIGGARGGHGGRKDGSQYDTRGGDGIQFDVQLSVPLSGTYQVLIGKPGGCAGGPGLLGASTTCTGGGGGGGTALISPSGGLVLLAGGGGGGGSVYPQPVASAQNAQAGQNGGNGNNNAGDAGGINGNGGAADQYSTPGAGWLTPSTAPTASSRSPTSGGVALNPATANGYGGVGDDQGIPPDGGYGGGGGGAGCCGYGGGGGGYSGGGPGSYPPCGGIGGGGGSFVGSETMVNIQYTHTGGTFKLYSGLVGVTTTLLVSLYDNNVGRTGSLRSFTV